MSEEKKPSNIGPKPINNSPKPTATGSKPSVTSPKPANNVPKPTKNAPKSAITPSNVGAKPAGSGPKPVEVKTKSAETSSVSNLNPVSTGKSPVPNRHIKPETKKVKTEDVNKNIKKEKSSDDKKRKRKILFWILILILLLLIFGLGIYLILRTPSEEFKFNLIVNSEIKTEIETSDGSMAPIKFYPGDAIEAKMNFQVVNEEFKRYENKKVYLRFKIDIEVDNNIYADLFSPILTRSDDWVVGDDGYWYYKVILYGDEEKHTAFETLIFEEERDNNFLNGKTGKMIFTVEIMEANPLAIGQVWPESPKEWRKVVRG